MCPHGTLKKSSWKTKQKELMKPTECSGVLVECEEVAGVSVNVCGVAEAPEEQAGK